MYRGSYRLFVLIQFHAWRPEGVWLFVCECMEGIEVKMWLREGKGIRECIKSMQEDQEKTENKQTHWTFWLWRTHSRRWAWWSSWPECWGKCSGPDRRSCRCAFSGSWWWSAEVRCTSGSCCRTRHTGWEGWTRLDTEGKRFLVPKLSNHDLLLSMESRQSVAGPDHLWKMYLNCFTFSSFYFYKFILGIHFCQ